MNEGHTKREKVKDVSIALALYQNSPKVFSNQTAHQAGVTKNVCGADVTSFEVKLKPI